MIFITYYKGNHALSRQVFPYDLQDNNCKMHLQDSVYILFK